MLEIRVLGPLGIVRDGEPVVPLGSPTQRLLLAVLSARRTVVARDRLVDAVWGDRPPRTAEQSLMAYISRLRRVLGSGAIERRAPGYILRADRWDSVTFETLVERAGADEPRTASSRLGEALALWQGPAFGEFAEHPDIVAEARRLEELRSAARERLAAAQLDTGRTSAAIATLEGLVSEEPLREGPWLLLVQALGQDGRKADALAAARRCREELLAVGLDPPRGIDDLQRRIHDLEPVAAGDVAEVPTERVVGNLPHPVSTFVGREAEIRDLLERARQYRLITLVGPGGVGKTRLALEAARRLPAPPSEGIWMCDLSTVGRPEDVPAAVASAIGLTTSGDARARILEAVESRSMMLVLDNCDHLTESAALLAEEVLLRCPGVRILATSREPLAVSGEHLLEVAPLDPDTEATTLFHERARASGATLAADDAAVRELAHHLDGLPLAIEMAAAWTRTMSVGDLSRHLVHRLALRSPQRRPDARHRTLRDVMSWSYSRLRTSEQRLFERLSVFSGSFSLQAAVEVAGSEPLDPADVPDLLRRLVDRSLLTSIADASGTRFRMLGTVAEYATERLDRSDAREQVVARSVGHFTDLAEAVAEGLRGSDEARWAATAQREMPNLRTAASRAIAGGLLDQGVRIPTALYLLVLERLRSEVAGWTRPILESAEPSRHQLLPALRAVVALGELQAGRPEAAATLASRAIDEANGSAVGRFAHHVLCELAFTTGRHDDGVHHATEVCRLAEQVEDHYLATHAFGDRCLHLAYSGERERARALTTELRHRARAVGAPTLQAMADFLEGEMLLDEDPTNAAALLDRASATAAAAGSAFVEGAARVSSTTIRARYGDPRRALTTFQEAIRHWHDRGDWAHQWPTLRNLVVLLVKVEEYQQAAVLLAAVDTLGGGTFRDEKRRVDAARRELEARLDADALRAAWERGRRMDRQALLQLALTATDARR